MNQKGVGAALKGLPRDSFFITTKTKPCAEMTEAACSAQAEKEFLQDLSDLGLDYVDLILLHGASHHGHGACAKPACTKDLGQWKAYEKLYKAGKAKAIGVSNYCVSCFECLVGAPGVTVVPCAPCLLLLTALKTLIRAVGMHQGGQPDRFPRGHGRRPGGDRLLLAEARHQDPGLLSPRRRRADLRRPAQDHRLHHVTGQIIRAGGA